MAIKLAFGTSLLVVLPTAASGAWRHHKKGAVWWKAAAVMGGTGLAFSFAGATLATHLPGAALKIAFGAVVLAVAVRMLASPPSETEEKPKDKPWLWGSLGHSARIGQWHPRHWWRGTDGSHNGAGAQIQNA